MHEEEELSLNFKTLFSGEQKTLLESELINLSLEIHWNNLSAPSPAALNTITSPIKPE